MTKRLIAFLCLYFCIFITKFFFVYFQLKKENKDLKETVEQLQQLNFKLQKEINLNDGKSGVETVPKNKVAVQSLIKHITPVLSEDKVY